MPVRTLLKAAVVSMSLAFPLYAADSGAELGAPIVELMPHVKKLGAKLNLSAEQKATLDAWSAEAPLKRKALEAEAMQLRAELREAILNGADRMKREQLKKDLAAKQTRLIEMRSLCTRMLRNTLDTEQFAKVVASYRAG